MKFLNISLIVLWFSVFFLSLTPTNPDVEQQDLHEITIYAINDVFTDIYPVFSQHGMTDNEFTVDCLRQTFAPLIVFALAINFAFYTGRGDLGNWTKEKWHKLSTISIRREMRENVKRRLNSLKTTHA